MSDMVGLDFETYGAVDLPKHGLARYLADKSFQVLLASVTEQNDYGVYLPVRYDFVADHVASVNELELALAGKKIVAHNAPFEQAVLATLGINVPSSQFIDSAVVARAAGAGSKLEAAAPQLLGVDKLESGKNLMRLFSMPGKYQEQNDSPLFDSAVVYDNVDEWLEYGKYCDLDSELGLRLVHSYMHWLTEDEWKFMAVTMDMNQRGWPVDVDLVREMNVRYLENQAVALEDFRVTHQAQDLNLNSLKQLKEWCLERGIKANSFDEKNTARLLERIKAKLESMPVTDPKREGYWQVHELLTTKQILGGSSLKKLLVILNTAVEESGQWWLKDQYLHVGAGQTLRTTGRSVQMQNLKRLGEDVADMATVFDPDAEWDNDALAANIRQAFKASHVDGRLIVGDFSSVEARGLAWLAGSSWKLDAFRLGSDMYKVAAAKQFSVAYDDVTKPQRQFGKVGELSCGYQAGGGAVKDFAEKMGVELSEAEANDLVFNWRQANPEIVNFWAELDTMLRRIVERISTQEAKRLPDGFRLVLEPVDTPGSLEDQVGGPRKVQSIGMYVFAPTGEPFLMRYFHGCYVRGNSICYFKPSDRKTGDLWRATYTNPKTKQEQFHSIYGGKLSGILTQSFCRELFMRVLRRVHEWCEQYPSVNLIGQFHDEIVLDWKPLKGGVHLDVAKRALEDRMSNPGLAKTFPLAAEVKDDYRYTK